MGGGDVDVLARSSLPAFAGRCNPCAITPAPSAAPMGPNKARLLIFGMSSSRQ
jgi:hypothetical protein